jgi:hypothetical protein
MTTAQADAWNAWIQAHLSNERGNVLADVVQTVNNLLGPFEQEIAELRKQIADVRAQKCKCQQGGSETQRLTSSWLLYGGGGRSFFFSDPQPADRGGASTLLYFYIARSSRTISNG